MPVLETDFLLGLRKDDKKHELYMKIIDLHRKGRTKNLAICSSAYAELSIGLRGKFPKSTIIEILRSLRALTHKIPEIKLSA